jgi:predicted CXXCH cytochrome family protein
MSKMKISFSFLLTLMLVAMFSIVASAAGSNPVGTIGGKTADPADVQNGLAPDDATHDNGINNVNKSGVGVGGQTANFNQVIKSDDMVKNADGTHGTQRTHGEYMNNTNSCASCHQTHTGASKNLLFKDGEYATCTACHDGTLGFYNVFTGSDSAGTFGGTHDGNMSAHLANGTVGVKAAPGGKSAGGGEWEAEFSCASCHAPHGSYSDRLLSSNPNHMGNLKAEEGGKRLEAVLVVTDITAKVTAADYNYTTDGEAKTVNYVVYKSVIGATVDADYTAQGLTTGDTVLQLMKWDSSLTTPKYIADKDPWLHGYDFDASHTKHYWTAFQDSTEKEYFHTDLLKDKVVYGKGFAGYKAADANRDVVINAKTGATMKLQAIVDGLQKGNIARGYSVKLALGTKDLTNNTWATNVSALWNSKDSQYVSGAGVSMSGFCSACHTDYLAKSGDSTGTFDHAYRHTTTSDSYTCVRCHYAHGTDVTVMRDARGLTYDQIKADTTNYFPTVVDPTAREAVVKDYLKDRNPSSALKRYTNMAVCWACHTSSHSEGTRNTDTYKYNSTPGIDTDRNGIETDY